MDKSHRLTRGSDFHWVRKQGRSWAHPLLIMSADRNELEQTRFGFIVSRRIGKAVTRNRVKRQLREAVRHHLGEAPVGWDIVLLARTPITEARFADIEDAVLQSLRRTRSWGAGRQAAVR